MRLKKESIEDNAEKTKALKGRGGGRLKYNNVDGDMPLCLGKIERKSKGGSSSNEGEKDDKSKMTSESKDLRGVTARKRNKQRRYIHRATEEYEINGLKRTN